MFLCSLNTTLVFGVFFFFTTVILSVDNIVIKPLKEIGAGVYILVD